MCKAYYDEGIYSLRQVCMYRLVDKGGGAPAPKAPPPPPGYATARRSQEFPRQIVPDCTTHPNTTVCVVQSGTI